jgi:preprotein translocase subunit SecE
MGASLEGGRVRDRMMTDAATTPKKKTGFLQFAREVRAEARKVTWTSRRETISATISVFIMVAIAAVFFTLVDMVLRWGVGAILGIGS